MDHEEIMEPLEDTSTCPVCNMLLDGNLAAHIRKEHGEDKLYQLLVAAKEQGTPDVEIGARYGVTYTYLQQAVTAIHGANTNLRKRSGCPKSWAPKDFRLEATTVWSFRQRGKWATHNGDYRGNWSPYIPRNVIARYSRPGDTVLDYFVGGGTTAIEAKLLGRRCIARDINPSAVEIARMNIAPSPPPRLFADTATLHEPDVQVGDARHLEGIADNSIDLICAHPPYAGIIQYSTGIENDLSNLDVDDFVVEIGKVALESWRVLKPGAKCAILIGDARKQKRVVPIGFRTIQAYLDAGFVLKDLVIKRQHNCRTTGFWYARSIKHNFLLLAHEYLPIFEKPELPSLSEQRSFWDYTLPHGSLEEAMGGTEDDDVETTTVWLFAQNQFEPELRRNLCTRFAGSEGRLIEYRFDEQGARGTHIGPGDTNILVYVGPPGELCDENALSAYRRTVAKICDHASPRLQVGDYLVVDTKDVRHDGILWPLGHLIWTDLSARRDLTLKEIIFVVPKEDSVDPDPSDELRITHRCLLVYARQ